MGVSDKLNEIYNLPDADLLVHVEALKNDFEAWISNNFVLTFDQSTYLGNISQ